MEMAGNLEAGVPFATPVFDGAKEEEIKVCAQHWRICRQVGSDDAV
jgi:hypothetical protein